MISNIKDFATMLHKLLRSDRDCIIAIGGFTGEGKSTFMTQLGKAYADVANVYFGLDRMTWSRPEMMVWIDGEKKTKEGQLPEYSVIMPDELFTMFYRRRWFEDEQIDAISTFNMCRDRHLLVIGNIPDFWQLDSGFTSRVRFYVYIPNRGIAWIFEQENNPFSTDRWNASENKRAFRKFKSPHKCPNFICQIRFPDWTTEEKKKYLKVRNEKRLKAIEQNKSQRIERYGSVKKQRDTAIRCWLNADKEITDKAAGEIVELERSVICKIRQGVI